MHTGKSDVPQSLKENKRAEKKRVRERKNLHGSNLWLDPVPFNKLDPSVFIVWLHSSSWAANQLHLGSGMRIKVFSRYIYHQNEEIEREPEME